MPAPQVEVMTRLTGVARPITPEMSRNAGRHAQAKGTTRTVAVVRASTGVTTHRPASARVRAWCHRSRDPSAGRDREPVCESHDSTGEPGAGNRPAGFGERGEETCPRESACGPVAKAPDEPPIPLPATRLPSTLLPFSFRVAWVFQHQIVADFRNGMRSVVKVAFCHSERGRRPSDAGVGNWSSSDKSRDARARSRRPGSGAVSDGPPRQRSIHVVKGPDRGKARPPRGVNPYIRAPAPTCTYDGRTSRPIPTSPPVSVRTDRGATVPARDSDGRARRTRRPANPCTCRARSMTLILCGGLRKSGQSSTSRS